MTESLSTRGTSARSSSTAAKPVPFRGGGFRTSPIPWISPVVFIGLIAFWHWGSTSGFIPALVLPSPGESLQAFINLFESGLLWLHVSASLQRLLIGWTAGTILGISVGLFVALSSIGRAAIAPLVAAIMPVPKIALLPLFIIWFGIGEGSKVATILFGVFFPTVISTFGAVDNVDRTLIRMGQSFGLSWSSIVRKIIFPGALPAILSGFRISASIAIILLVAAEMIGAQYGIGAYVLLAGSLMATDQLIAGVAILSALGLTVSYLIGRAERYFLGWRT
ncbi:ABC transporter permease [Saccharospirillum impatiens]|uniref:ABC transporter permease n=1 Tax=Saccharospirillum impatiens TaxID=169438 RepID=UPI0005641571|nr:ABC transporter permease [Saccharospirillum impatiens]